MNTFLAEDYFGSPFVLFDIHHLIILAAIFLIVSGLLCFGRNIPSIYHPSIRYTMAFVLLGNEAFWHVWFWLTGQWSAQNMLPLEFCSVAICLSAVMLMTRSYRLYEPVYFIGIGGTIQALLTPNLTKYGFPHALFFQFFISHGMLLIVAVYMTAVEGYRPYFSSIKRVFVMASIYSLCVGGIDALLGSNYLFLAHKPDTRTVLDMLPAWPWYIPFMMMGFAMTMLVLYLPFAVSDYTRHSAKNHKHKKDEPK